MRTRLIERWVKPPWEWTPAGALAVFILVAAIVLLIERDRIISIQIGGEKGVIVGMAIGPPDPVPPPGEQVEISALLTGLEPITQPSTCSLTILFPGQEPIRTGPEAVIEDGSISWLLPSEDFASVVGATPVSADVTADCNVSDEDFEIAAKLDFVSE